MERAGVKISGAASRKLPKMFGRIVKHRSVIVTLVLAMIGLVLLVAAQTFQHEWLKVQLDRIVAEVGALILVVGILHWLFELGLRQEMLREISGAVIGSTLLHENGLDSCTMNSRQVDDSAHWSQSANLTIGLQYSPRFFKDFHHVLRARCTRGLSTTVTVLRPEGTAAQYLQGAMAGNPAVKESVTEIAALLGDIDTRKKKCTRLVLHDRVLRYSFIKTDEYMWIKFFTNSAGRANVPALKVRGGSPLFQFFSEDIARLLDGSREN